jgi:cytochrome c peroxidase
MKNIGGCALGGFVVAVLTVASGCDGYGGFLCSGSTCGWSEHETSALVSLGGMPTVAPNDTSNKYATSVDAAALGKQLYFDTRFAGPSNQLDALNRPMPFGRTTKGTPAAVACATCHDGNHAGIDPSSIPGHVSLGAGWGFANGLSTYNSAFYTVKLWTGRADSLWAQAIADNENPLTTNGNRLKTAWAIAELYRGAYENVFTEFPLPMPESLSSSALLPLLESEGPSAGQCKLAGGACPASCQMVTATTGGTGCWPRFPLQGKPGKVAGCQSGSATEPFGDAFDCMADDDQKAVTRVLVNFGKAIAAYEQLLVTPGGAFDRWVADVAAGMDESSTAISLAAQRGAHLFVGKAGCSDCHNTPLMTDNQFHNIGVQQIGMGVPTVNDCPAGGVCDCAPASDTHAGPKNCIPWGAYDGIDKLQHNLFRRDSSWSDDPADDSRMSFVKMALSPALEGGYRTPSLRNVALTGPYMHDGSITSLEDVIWHYNTGGSSNSPGSRAAEIKPLYLSDRDQSDLVAFLRALDTDPIAPEVVTAPTLP